MDITFTRNMGAYRLNCDKIFVQYDVWGNITFKANFDNVL